MVHASRGRWRPASPHLLSRGRDRLRGSARAVLGDDAHACPGRTSPTTTTLIRDRIARVVPGFEDFNDARAPAAAASPCPTPPRDERTLHHRRPARPTSPSTPLEVLRAARRAACCCRRCARTTSTTPPSTASTTATAASRAAAASSSSTPTTSPTLGLADGDVVDLVSEWPTASERARRALPRRRLPDRARLRGRLLPRDQRAGPAGQHRGRQQHADLQVGRRPAGAGLSYSAGRAATASGSSA